ncbi:MAG: O-antigen ligase family protein [Dissulfuribacterales bacterium]
MTNKLRSVVIFIILLAPASTNLVRHAGSSIMLVLTLLGIYTFFKRGRIEFSTREKGIMGTFAGYFFFCLLMSAGHNLFNGISPFKWDVDHEVRMLTILPIYYLFIQAKLEREIIWYGVVAGAISSGIYALFESIATGFSSRIIGPYNPCLFGYFSVALAFMSLSGYHFFYNKNKKLIILPLLGFICGLLAAFFSGTRGSVITIPFLTLLFIFQIKRHLNHFNTKITLAAIISIFIFMLLLFPHTYLEERFKKGIDEARYYIKNHECVACIEKHEAHHLRMWIEALNIIKDHPITGVGANGYQQIVISRINNHKIASGIEDFQSPHNMYLTMLTAHGIFGLIVLLAIFLVPLSGMIYGIKNSGENSDLKDISYCGLFLIVGYILFSMTGTLFNRNMLISFYIILIAATLSVNRPIACRTTE